VDGKRFSAAGGNSIDSFGCLNRHPAAGFLQPVIG
jgi:hypothetical protein